MLNNYFIKREADSSKEITLIMKPRGRRFFKEKASSQKRKNISKLCLTQNCHRISVIISSISTRDKCPSIEEYLLKYSLIMLHFFADSTPRSLTMNLFFQSNLLKITKHRKSFEGVDQQKWESVAKEAPQREWPIITDHGSSKR